MIMINFIAFQLCWLAAVWGAANNMGWLGPVAVSLFVAWELSKTTTRRRDLQLLGLTALLGLTIDTAYQLLGLIEFASPGLLPMLAPLWIVTMWVSFALTINSSMHWLIGKPLLAAGFGLLGGPLAYWIAAEIWGAATFTAPLPLCLAVIGIAWAVVTPFLMALSTALSDPAQNAELSPA